MAQQIYGIVTADGKKNSGSGFSVSRDEEGKYSITWDNQFAQTPGVAATIVRLSDQWYPTDGVDVGNVTNAGCMVFTMKSNSYSEDRDFSIIAIGD
ncbi:hypothetical protein ACFVQ4_32930 [Streptomyces laurentii]|uniref:hypothetical protein n=1 Tax=Streptomyces laurentii TaxID=39478 RepID=UPI003688AFC0